MSKQRGTSAAAMAAACVALACGGQSDGAEGSTRRAMRALEGTESELPGPASEAPVSTDDAAAEAPGGALPLGDLPLIEQPVETSGTDCLIPALPGIAELAEIESLPDPFLGLSGTRITSRAEWTCRRAEIRAQVEHYELGPKPARPSIVSGELVDNQLTVTVGEAESDRRVSFSVNITRPAESTGSVPALIEIGGSSLDNSVFAEAGVARITLNNGAIGAQAGASSRGTGLFYDLYGADHGAGSMMAWAWGVSRLIDALERTPEANIDTRRLAVTGCSRNGKGALVVGAFDERIALTIPQESGAGGSASWRVSQVQENAILAANPEATVNDRVQTISSAVGEQPWFRASFSEFSNAVTRLPFDHHMVMGLVAPRGLFVVDNTSMNWLGNESSFTDSVAANEVWKGLGAAERMGASQLGDHNHCQFPAAQRAELVAFVQKFLKGDESVDTNILRSDRIVPDRARWMPWAGEPLL